MTGLSFNSNQEFFTLLGYAVSDGIKDHFYRLIESIEAKSGDALKAARINAATVATTAEIEGMKAANEDRSRNGYAMAYSDSAFDAVADNLRKQVEEILGS